MKKFDFTIQGNKYEVELKKFEENIAEIEVNGTVYQVEVHREIKQSKTPTLVRTELPAPARRDTKIRKNISSKAIQIKTPLPGTIQNIYVREGDEVTKGQKLVMYEAMKMENNILAEKDGVIRSIKVKIGDNVLQDEVLMEME